MKRKSQVALFVVLSQLIFFCAPLFAGSFVTITNVSDTIAKVEYKPEDGPAVRFTLQPGESKVFPQGVAKG